MICRRCKDTGRISEARQSVPCPECHVAKPLTDRQREIYQYLVQHVSRKNYPPSVRDVCERFGIQLKAAADHFEALEAKGYIERLGRYKAARALTVVVSESTYAELCEALADVIWERVK